MSLPNVFIGNPVLRHLPQYFFDSGMTYFVENEGGYWRDIKFAIGDVNVLKLNVESGLRGLTTTIKWKPSEINALKAVLTDDQGNFLADMKDISSHEYLNHGKRSFVIEIFQN